VFAALVISGGSSAWIAGAILLISIGVLAAGYLRGPAPRGVRIAGFCLKLLAVLALLVCLLEPSWTGQRAGIVDLEALAVVGDDRELVGSGLGALPGPGRLQQAD
jgi:hypothetical protein